MIQKNQRYKTALVPVKDLYSDRDHGLSVSKLQYMSQSLRGGNHFSPIECVKKGNRYEIVDGRHRWICYIIKNREYCYVCYPK